MVRKFTSLYKDDPIAEELEAGIRGTDVYQGSPYALGNVPGFEGMKYATPDYNKYADLYNLYLGGGFDAAQDDFVTPGPAAPIGGGGGGGTGTTIGGTAGGTDFTGVNPFADIDTGVGEFDNLTGTPTSDPFLASGAAGGARLPSTLPQEGFLASGAAGGARLPEDDLMDYDEHYDMRTAKKTNLEDAFPGWSNAEIIQGYKDEDATQQGDIIIPPAKPTTFGTPTDDDIAVGVEQGFTGDFSAPRTLADIMEKRDFVSGADVANPKTLLDKLGLSQLNPAEAAVKMIINKAAGGPITLLFDLLKGILPKMDPRQKELRKFYNLDDIGRVAEGELMAGYSPVSGGFPGVSEPTYGLQKAYDERIDTIENTLKRKGLTDTDIADIYAGAYDPEKTGIESDLIQRLVDLKEAKEKEKARLDLFSGDIDDRDQMLEDIMAQEKATTEIEPTRLRHLTGDLDLDKQATIPLGPEPLLKKEELGRTYQDEKTALPIWIPEKKEQDLQEELALEKELADQRDRDEAAAKAREDAAATARENARRKADADRRAAEQRARDEAAARARARHDDPPPSRSTPPKGSYGPWS